MSSFQQLETAIYSLENGHKGTNIILARMVKQQVMYKKIQVSVNGY